MFNSYGRKFSKNFKVLHFMCELKYQIETRTYDIKCLVTDWRRRQFVEWQQYIQRNAKSIWVTHSHRRKKIACLPSIVYIIFKVLKRCPHCHNFYLKTYSETQKSFSWYVTLRHESNFLNSVLFEIDYIYIIFFIKYGYV